jgi:hypothetical protein
MKTYIFFREGFFYPVEEESDEKVLAHVSMNPGTLRVETIDGKVLYDASKPN